MKKIFLAFCMFILLTFCIGADNAFDGEILSVEQLPEEIFPPIVHEIRIGQLVLIDGFPHSNPLAEGIEITIHPPENTRVSGSAFALYMFQEVEPRDITQTIADLRPGGIGNLKGRRIAFELLPARSPFSIRLPARQDHSIRGGIDARVTSVIDAELVPVALTILPIMKGLPSDQLNAPFRLSIQPILSQTGGLKVSVFSHNGEQLSQDDIDDLDLVLSLDRYGILTVDETSYIRPGIYQIMLNRGTTLYDAAQVGVERGSIQEVSLVLPRPESRVFFDFPEFISVSLNGEPVTADSMYLTPGEYEIELKFESFTRTQNLSIQAGRDYSLGVDLALLVNDAPEDLQTDD